MLVKARGKFLRVSPTKVREVIDLIRGKDVNRALGILRLVDKRPKEFIINILDSAVANAKHKGVALDKLYISKINADEGAMWKRYRAASFGRAVKIRRRTTHLNIELDLRS